MTTQNILQQVATYNKASLGYLRNTSCLLNESNKKFQNFNTDYTANLGSTVKFDLPYRLNTVRSLVFAEQALEQRVDTITVGQEYSSSVALDTPDRIFNFNKSDRTEAEVDYYMGTFGKGFIDSVSTEIETTIASNFISKVPVKNVSTGTTSYDKTTGGYRFYGNGVTPINSQTQLAEMNAIYRAFGSVNGVLDCYLPSIKIPQFLNTFLNEFVPNRNEEIAKSWMLGNYNNVSYYESNVLQKHVAGNVGVYQQTLTVVSVITDSNGFITGFTASGATPNDANAIFAGDMLQFNLSGTESLSATFGSFQNGIETNLPAQNRIMEDSAADSSGIVTINLFRPFAVGSAIGDQINITKPIVAGMTFTIPKSHIAGSLNTKSALLVAMPRLADAFPFASSSLYDEDSGASMLLSYGSLLGMNTTKIGVQALTGTKAVPDYFMRVCFPLS